MDSYSGKVVITFHSHYDAMRQKRLLRMNGVEAELVPVPRSLSSSCGSAIVVGKDDLKMDLLIDDIEGLWLNEEDKWSSLPRL